MIKGLHLFLILMVLASCNQNPNHLSEEERASYIQLGDSITSVAQSVLMQNVAAAIQQGGTEYAVEFCNTRAIPLTDSIAENLGVEIQRLSNRNRNPINAIQTGWDQTAWQKIQADRTHLIEQDPKGEVYYYKPISIAMPTCIQCHGGKTDISASTHQVIARKYPLDKAIGYEMGDLRGMWKIHWRGDKYPN